MTSKFSRVAVLAALAIVAWLVAAGAAPTPAPNNPDKLVILSTVDAKGKTSPCG